jgi:hypothetical protein
VVRDDDVGDPATDLLVGVDSVNGRQGSGEGSKSHVGDGRRVGIAGASRDHFIAVHGVHATFRVLQVPGEFAIGNLDR